jgi:hypothetical protein
MRRFIFNAKAQRRRDFKELLTTDFTDKHRIKEFDLSVFIRLHLCSSVANFLPLRLYGEIYL